MSNNDAQNARSSSSEAEFIVCAFLTGVRFFCCFGIEDDDDDDNDDVNSRCAMCINDNDQVSSGVFA